MAQAIGMHMMSLMVLQPGPTIFWYPRKHGSSTTPADSGLEIPRQVGGWQRSEALAKALNSNQCCMIGDYGQPVFPAGLFSQFRWPLLSSDSQPSDDCPPCGWALARTQRAMVVDGQALTSTL